MQDTLVGTLHRMVQSTLTNYVRKTVSGFLSQSSLNMLYWEKKKSIFMLFATFLSKSIVLPLTHFSIYHFAAAVVHLPVLIYFLKLNWKLANIVIIKKFKVLVFTLKDAHITAFLMNAFFLLYKRSQLLRALHQHFQRAGIS